MDNPTVLAGKSATEVSENDRSFEKMQVAADYSNM